MKKIIILFILFWGLIANSQSKIEGQSNSLPEGLFLNDIFDQNGNKYKLADIQIGTIKYSKINNSQLSSTLLCTSGIFDLYFETGSGMEDNSIIQTQRRAVVCRVFQDISDFINTPLKNSGNTAKVKIWVRDISQVLTSTQLPASSSNVGGLATAFYNFPYNATSGFGGIADNEIWKTIHLGKDSFTNVIPPLVSTSPNPGNSGLFYHGMVAFNFSNTSFVWNTNYSIATPTGSLDLYSAMLHEVVHALGFNSLINASGSSMFGPGYNYFTRYDRFLKNNAATSFLITNSTSCSMYNYKFNAALSSSILQPNTSNCIIGQTTCSTAIKYVGSSTVPVYTPNCFSNSSSLSHFEDQCIGPPNANNINTYFAMTDATSAGITKRSLKNEERNALNDVGYKLNQTFGNNAVVFGSYFNYGYTTTGISVAGLNDGLSGNAFTLIGQSGVNILINSPSSSILNNDYTTTLSNLRFECLQDVFDNTSSISLTSGDKNTIVNFSSTKSGLHLLRYIPYDISNSQRGNITYIYVYVQPIPSVANCTPEPSICNLVNNGNFEQKSAAPTSVDQMELACGWLQTGYSLEPTYNSSDSTVPSYQVPCNYSGYENDKLGFKSYLSLNLINDWNTSGPVYESAKTQLSSPLTPNTEYQLSFDVSLQEGNSTNAVKWQAALTAIDYAQFAGGTVPITGAPNLSFEDSSFSRTINGWDHISFTFTTGNISGEKYLYVGGLNNMQFSTNTPSTPVIPGCNYNTLGNLPPWPAYGLAKYYLDNVTLIPTNGVKLTTPASVCTSQIIADLMSYVSGAPANGTFEIGDGVTSNGGSYAFNGSLAGVGLHQITYNYVNNVGCLISISTKITVSACSSTSCPGILIFNLTEPATNATYQAASSITANGNYLVNSGSTITLKAGGSITFSPNSEVKAGSDFTALIGQCTQTSARFADEDENPVVTDDVLKIFPNPSNGQLSIEMLTGKFAKIIISSLDGKLIFDKKIEPTNSYQLDISSYNNGLYILSIETTDGKNIYKKIMKN